MSRTQCNCLKRQVPWQARTTSSGTRPSQPVAACRATIPAASDQATVRLDQRPLERLHSAFHNYPPEPNRSCSCQCLDARGFPETSTFLPIPFIRGRRNAQSWGLTVRLGSLSLPLIAIESSVPPANGPNAPDQSSSLACSRITAKSILLQSPWRSKRPEHRAPVTGQHDLIDALQSANRRPAGVVPGGACRSSLRSCFL